MGVNTDDILKERGARYGSFETHARITQEIKTVMYGYTPMKTLRDFQKESLDMIAHKIGRIVNGDPDYIDSWDDIAGYAKLVADILRGEKK